MSIGKWRVMVCGQDVSGVCIDLSLALYGRTIHDKDSSHIYIVWGKVPQDAKNKKLHPKVDHSITSREKTGTKTWTKVMNATKWLI